MSDRSPAHPAADRNLLFGILALQMDFISRDALLQAMSAWVLAKHKPLGQVLEDNGALTAQHRAMLEPLVDAHIRLHGDAEKSLAAVSSVGSMREELERIGDPDLQASLPVIGSAHTPAIDSNVTCDYVSAGESTSAGQRFRILRPHAKGGLGEVFVARDEELHREVALKQIQHRHAHDAHRLRPQPRRPAPRLEAGQHHARSIRRDFGSGLGPGQGCRPPRANTSPR
jgi:eukaryotic-like serine/threonine-protein kinase